jgi:uncharacterized membrane protein YoaK (UPF0700 family)
LTAHMTGHTVLRGLALVQADQQEVLLYCVVLRTMVLAEHFLNPLDTQMIS